VKDQASYTFKRLGFINSGVTRALITRDVTLNQRVGGSRPPRLI
jgi:hypothetical protein